MYVLLSSGVDGELGYCTCFRPLSHPSSLNNRIQDLDLHVLDLPVAQGLQLRFFVYVIDIRSY